MKENFILLYSWQLLIKIVSFPDEEALYKKGLFNYGFWVTSIISAALCIVFGLISVGFAIFNICGKPIETITGPMGLYLWNGAACKLFVFFFKKIKVIES